MEIVKKHISKIQGKTLHFNDVRLFIMMNFGADERTLKSYMDLLRFTGIIKEVEHLKYFIVGLTNKHRDLLSDEVSDEDEQQEEGEPQGIASKESI